jgi:hypothetical protein
MAENKEHWLEQGTNMEQLVMHMKLLSTQFQHFLASQITRKETGDNFKGILTTPGLDRDVETNASVEKITPEHKTQSRGNKMTGQELNKTRFNIPLPRVELPTF